MISNDHHATFDGNMFPLALHDVIAAAQQIQDLFGEIEPLGVGKPIKYPIEARFIGKSPQHAGDGPANHRVLSEPWQTFGKGLFNVKHDRLPWF
ncbi:hypothetical protein GCM10007901_21870 [Dyella acidisoli]|uniref:Uncharacterized protein n=1 Tax=Dyella acidisoli TaxID=1867834 RepID=A0ABQ5XNF4_9GAMM|nr:hypothetical protein GCM10007901_21870 [Dyella acidisoli]